MRAYVMPLALVRNIRHLTPCVESISLNKILIPTDPQLQFLNPASSIREIEMPDPSVCEGQIFWIENTSPDIGILRVYDENHIQIIAEIRGGQRTAIISASDGWHGHSPGGAGERFETTISSWTVSGGLYMATITHGLNQQFPLVECYDTATNEVILPQSLKMTGQNIFEIWMPTNTETIKVVVIG